jgi:hypothetical protein
MSLFHIVSLLWNTQESFTTDDLWMLTVKWIYFLQDLQQFLDESPDGVIYFSMGSNLRSSNFKNATTKAFLKAFSNLKQRVLWKWETDSLPGQPSNVKLCKWLPQSDILGEFISFVSKWRPCNLIFLNSANVHALTLINLMAWCRFSECNHNPVLGIFRA